MLTCIFLLTELRIKSYDYDDDDWHCCMLVDVGDWLNELGYYYDSLIPAVSYSGLVDTDPPVSTPSDSDVSARVAVTSAFRCAYDGNMARFQHLSTVSASLVTNSQTTAAGELALV